MCAPWGLAIRKEPKGTPCVGLKLYYEQHVCIGYLVHTMNIAHFRVNGADVLLGGSVLSSCKEYRNDISPNARNRVIERRSTPAWLLFLGTTSSEGGWVHESSL